VSQVWAALLARPERYVRVNPAVFCDPAVTCYEYVARYVDLGPR
jgi:hypothetical protein